MSDPQADLASATYRIGLGTYTLGPETFSVCLRALELGYRHIDTARLYRNEKAVSRAIEQSGINRQDLFLTTKVSIRDAVTHNIPTAIEQSIKVLGKIDLILLHGPTNHFAKDWDILCHEAQTHRISNVGVSNFQQQHLEALADSKAPKVNQIEISPFLPRIDLANYCREKGIIVTAHSPLTKGRRLDNPVLTQIATQHQATTAQIMIAWSLAKGYIPLARSRNEEHLAQNLAADQLELSPKDIAQLDELEDGYATHPQHIE